MGSSDRGASRDGWFLGIGASHNGSACLVRGSELVVAVQEERLTGIKRDRTWLGRDLRCVRYVLDVAGVRPDQLSGIGVCSQPPLLLPDNDLRRNPVLAPVLHTVPVFRLGHHLAHAISVFDTSGFDVADVLVVDGMGSPTADLSSSERAVIKTNTGGYESVSMYRADDGGVRPVMKYLGAPQEWWLEAVWDGEYLERCRTLISDSGGVLSNREGRVSVEWPDDTDGLWRLVAGAAA